MDRAFNIGLRACAGWGGRGEHLPTPPDNFNTSELRDWVRGWNAVIAGGKGRTR